MEIDEFLDSDCCECCECCCGKASSCAGVIAVTFINVLSSGIARAMLVFSKIGGIVLDILAILSVANPYTKYFLMAWACFDRLGALIMLCIYGYRIPACYKRYVYYEEARGEVKGKGLESLYIGSMFSLLDFMGKIWKSYTFVIEIDPSKVKKYEDRDTNDTKTEPAVQETIDTVPDNTVPIQVIYDQPQQLQSEQKPLPNGWSVRTDPNGRVYFHNDITQKAQWEHPLNTEIVYGNAPSMTSYNAPKPMQIQQQQQPQQYVEPNQIQMVVIQQPQTMNNDNNNNTISNNLERVTSNHGGKACCFVIFYGISVISLMGAMFILTFGSLQVALSEAPYWGYDDGYYDSRGFYEEDEIYDYEKNPDGYNEPYIEAYKAGVIDGEVDRGYDNGYRDTFINREPEIYDYEKNPDDYSEPYIEAYKAGVIDGESDLEAYEAGVYRRGSRKKYNNRYGDNYNNQYSDRPQFDASIFFILATFSNVMGLTQHSIVIGRGTLRKCKTYNNCCCTCCAGICCFIMGLIGVVSFGTNIFYSVGILIW